MPLPAAHRDYGKRSPRSPTLRSPPPLHFLIEFPLLYRNCICPPFSLQAGGAWKGSLLCKVNQKGWGSEGEKEGAIRGWRAEMEMLLGFPLCLSGSLGCEGTLRSWREEEEKRKSSQGKFFPLSLCPVITHAHSSLCKLTCGFRKANWDMSCKSRPKKWRQRKEESDC